MEAVERRRTATVESEAVRADPAPRPLRVLVATSGTPSAEPALRLAKAMATETGAAVELVSVFTPPVPIPQEAAGRRISCERRDRGQVATLARQVRRQRREVGAGPLHWPIRLCVGNPAEVIAKIARDDGFDIILLGIGRPDVAERLRGGETAFHLTLSATVPVLAVSADLADRPHRAVVVIDSMDDVDRRLLQTVVSLLAAPAELRLALTQSSLLDATSGVRAVRDAGVPDSVEVSAVPVPAEAGAVVALGRRVGANLIAAPAHGRTPEERLIMQDLVVPILRSANCSVLAVPPASDG